MILIANGSLMKIKSIAECSPWSILQYFWPALNNYWSWKPIYGLFESSHFTQVLCKAVGLLLLTFCLLLLPLWESVIVVLLVVRYFMSILVLQSSWWGRESWLLCLICLPGVPWWLSGSSSRCHRVVCGLWLWCFLIILTYYFFYCKRK